MSTPKHSSNGWTDSRHPRPDLERRQWWSLNGSWDLAVDDGDYDRMIIVPFVHQSARSGLGDITKWARVRYRRTLEVPPVGDGRLLLHFGAVDFTAEVVINGVTVGSHRGGHTSFTIDVTDHVTGSDDVLEVLVDDPYRADQARGKQAATMPYMVHYTASTGIWQTVWLELAGPAPVAGLQIVAGADGDLSVTVDVSNGWPAAVAVTLFDAGAPVLELSSTVDGRQQTLRDRVGDVRQWSPDDPHLYELVVTPLDAAGNVLDEVHSWVGFRTVEIRDGRWYLNGQRLSQRLVLDQGYWPDSLLTPPSDEAIRADLDFVKAAGFDGVRKHQKIEDPRWLWWADRLGVLVWEEMPSPLLTALVEGELAVDMLAEWSEAIVRDRNHPSIICWVPFNESWGIRDIADNPDRQATVRRFVDHTRHLDPTRPVCDNSGWAHVAGDIVDVHDYIRDPAGLVDAWHGARERGFARRGKSGLDPDALALIDRRRLAEHHDVERLRHLDPLVLAPFTDTLADDTELAHATMMLSEFGGIGFDPEHTEDTDTFVYGFANTADELLARVCELVDAANSVADFDGWCWTQLTDVEQERNGLMTADRQPKIAAADLRTAIRGRTGANGTAVTAGLHDE